jgi:hypothetical protein
MVNLSDAISLAESLAKWKQQGIVAATVMKDLLTQLLRVFSAEFVRSSYPAHAGRPAGESQQTGMIRQHTAADRSETGAF